MSLRRIFGNISEKMRSDFEEAAKTIEHPLESGRGRENVLTKFLRKYLPERFHVDSGFVIDARGNISRQIDVIIFDKVLTPVLEVVEGVHYFPCETVVSVGEVKSDVNSTSKLRDALDKIRSVKSLDRSNQGKNLIATGPGMSISAFHFDPEKNYRDQIFGFVFTADSMKEETIVRAILNYNKEIDRKLWLNLFVDYNNRIISYEGKEGLPPSPMDAENLYCTMEREKPNLFILFYAILFNFLRQAHVAYLILFDYLRVHETFHRDYKLRTKFR